MFETSPSHERPELQPLHVARRRDGLFEAAKEMVADLPGWTVLRIDDGATTLICERQGSFLGGTTRVTIRVEGPDELPSATLHLRAEAQGGLFANEKAVVAEFMKPFIRRVC